jgi:hypothetical protein
MYIQIWLSKSKFNRPPLINKKSKQSILGIRVPINISQKTIK